MEREPERISFELYSNAYEQFIKYGFMDSRLLIGKLLDTQSCEPITKAGFIDHKLRRVIYGSVSLGFTMNVIILDDQTNELVRIDGSHYVFYHIDAIILEIVKKKYCDFKDSIAERPQKGFNYETVQDKFLIYELVCKVLKKHYRRKE